MKKVQKSMNYCNLIKQNKNIINTQTRTFTFTSKTIALSN